jgi:type IV secretory pathway VirB3-like protein
MFAVISILTIAFGLMLGLLRPGQALSKLSSVLIGLAFIPILLAVAKTMFVQAPFIMQAALILACIPLLLFAGIRVLFGRRVYDQVLGHFLYDALSRTFHCCSQGVRLVGVSIAKGAIAIRGLLAG